jgi:hypothetical protein
MPEVEAPGFVPVLDGGHITLNSYHKCCILLPGKQIQ